jgi:hypothetical protein
MQVLKLFDSSVNETVYHRVMNECGDQTFLSIVAAAFEDTLNYPITLSTFIDNAVHEQKLLGELKVLCNSFFNYDILRQFFSVV